MGFVWILLVNTLNHQLFLALAMCLFVVDIVAVKGSQGIRPPPQLLFCMEIKGKKSPKRAENRPFSSLIYPYQGGLRALKPPSLLIHTWVCTIFSPRIKKNCCVIGNEKHHFCVWGSQISGILAIFYVIFKANRAIKGQKSNTTKWKKGSFYPPKGGVR